MQQACFGWLVSYPKSGNTWVRLLLESLMNGGRAVDITALDMRTPVASRQEFDQLFGIDSAILTDREIEAARPMLFRLAAQSFDGPLILRKVHDRCWRAWTGERVFPPELSRGAIYIARDPRDVAVSASHYFHIGMEESIDRLGNHDEMLGKNEKRYSRQLPQPLGTWSEHFASWLDDSDMPVHLIRYEDLLRDTAGELRKAAAFLDLPDDFADLAASATDFHKLQLQEAEKGFAEKLPSCRKFFREGRAGGWQSVLSAAQSDRIVNDHGTVMDRLHYT